jgi:hypothetical protein
MRTPLREINDPCHQWSNGLVRCDQVPMTIDGNRGVRFLARKQQIDRSPRRAESRVAQRSFSKGWGVSRPYQQNVSFAQRDIESFGKVQNHVSAWQRTAGFKKAEMPGRNLRFASECELTETPALAPFAQMLADWSDIAHHD